MLNVNRGLSWDDAVAYRDAALAQAVDAGEELDRNVGFYTDRFVKDHGKTGAPHFGLFFLPSVVLSLLSFMIHWILRCSIDYARQAWVGI